MALQGTFSGTTSNSRIKPTITWSATQSVTENYSQITATLTYKRNNSYTTAGAWSGSLTIGTQVFTDSKSIQITNTDDAVAITATAQVPHDEYGELTVTISATGAVSGSSLSATRIEADVQLDPIPRAAAISCPDGDIESRTTIAVARKNSAFTHSIAYRFGTLAGYIDAQGDAVEQETKMQEAAVAFFLPESFYGQIPNAPSGECTLTCRTYSGEDLIGQTTATFTVTAAPENCAPMVSGTVMDCNDDTLSLTGDNGVLVRYRSEALCTISAQGQKGATIVTRRIAGMEVTQDSLRILNPYREKIAFSATDSRGYTTTCQVPVNLLAYVVPTNSATAQRSAEGENQVQVNLRGNCWEGDFGTVENTLSATVHTPQGADVPVELTVADGHYSGSVLLEGLTYDKRWELTVTVRDRLVAVPKQLQIEKGIPVFDWGNEDFRFHVPVEVPALTIAGKSLEAYIRQLMEET